MKLNVRHSALFVALLMLPVGWPPPVSADADEKPSPDGRLLALLRLRELVLSGLEMQESAAELAKRAETPVPSGTLDDVLAGARALASDLAAETAPPAVPSLATTRTATSGRDSTVWAARTTPSWLNATGNSTAAAGIFSAGWFQHVHSLMLSVMPLSAWIAVFAVVGFILIAILVLVIICCYRMRDADRLDGRYYYGGSDDGPPQTFTYKDIDIIGRKQPPFGVINFSVEYDVATCNLIVTAFSCVGLPKELKSLDPYVVVRLDLPVMGKKRNQQQQQETQPPVIPLGGDANERSKVVKNNVNPAFNFTRIFKIKDKRLLKNMKIIFEVYDWDIGTRHRMIARRVLNFARLGEKLDDILGRRVEYTRDLQPPVIEEATGPGDVCLAMCYSDVDKHLWVQVIECKGVFLQKFDQPDLETMPNTYVKLSLSVAGSAKRLTKSTKLVRESRNPYFNDQFIFKIDPVQLYLASLRVSLVHRTDTLRIKRILGVLTLSKEAEKDSLARLHWTEAVAHHSRPTARWHTLITPEAERKRADRKAQAELKRKLEEAEDAAQTDPQAPLAPPKSEE